MPKYYDWNATLAYDADVTMVVGARGIGKTYGIRLQCIRDFIKRGWRFVEIVRYKSELSGVSAGYFNRIDTNNEFGEYLFRTEGAYGYIADKPEGEQKPKWKLMCYFIAMSDAQQLKKRTFDKVKRIIFDEAVLDKLDRYHHYLPHEFSTLANLVDTVSRERADTDSIAPRIYLLGNALDLMNPYFIAYGVNVPRKGYSWHKGKTMLLHYADDKEYSKEKASQTVAGRMLYGTVDGAIANDNEFARQNKDFIYKKTKNSKFSFGVVFDGWTFGIWDDREMGYYYVTNKVPQNTRRPIFAVTVEDDRVNYVAARKAEQALKGFTEMHYLGIIRYESVAIREKFVEVLQMFGVR